MPRRLVRASNIYYIHKQLQASITVAAKRMPRLHEREAFWGSHTDKPGLTVYSMRTNPSS